MKHLDYIVLGLFKMMCFIAIVSLVLGAVFLPTIMAVGTGNPYYFFGYTPLVLFLAHQVGQDKS